MVDTPTAHTPCLERDRQEVTAPGEMKRQAYWTAKCIGPVYPTDREKVPLVHGGYKTATRDFRRIAAWWYKFPNANIGLVLEDMVVIDLDSADAEMYFAELQESICKLPDTRQVKSSRGRHLYYRVPAGTKIPSSQSKLAAGIDVVGTGCGVIAPPSVHKSGHVYRWLNDLPIAVLPIPWIILTQQANLFYKVRYADPS